MIITVTVMNMLLFLLYRKILYLHFIMFCKSFLYIGIGAVLWNDILHDLNIKKDIIKKYINILHIQESVHIYTYATLFIRLYMRTCKYTYYRKERKSENINWVVLDASASGSVYSLHVCMYACNYDKTTYMYECIFIIFISTNC